MTQCCPPPGPTSLAKCRHRCAIVPANPDPGNEQWARVRSDSDHSNPAEPRRARETSIHLPRSPKCGPERGRIPPERLVPHRGCERRGARRPLPTLDQKPGRETFLLTPAGRRSASGYSALARRGRHRPRSPVRRAERHRRAPSVWQEEEDELPSAPDPAPVSHPEIEADDWPPRAEALRGTVHRSRALPPSAPAPVLLR